jgi:hypothetical protein
MIDTVIVPKKRKAFFQLPDNYVGLQLRVIAFPVSATPVSATPDRAQTHLASEMVLAKDWITPEEDAAWKDL